MCTEIITQQTIEIADEPLLLRHMTVVSEHIFDFWTWPRVTPRNKRPLRALPTARCDTTGTRKWKWKGHSCSSYHWLLQLQCKHIYLICLGIVFISLLPTQSDFSWSIIRVWIYALSVCVYFLHKSYEFPLLLICKVLPILWFPPFHFISAFNCYW